MRGLGPPATKLSPSVCRHLTVISWSVTNYLLMQYIIYSVVSVKTAVFRYTLLMR